MTDSLTEFHLHVDDAALIDLKRRLEHVRWPQEIPDVGWDYGVPVSYMQDVHRHWTTSYDWRAFENRLNAFDQYTTDIDGVRVHLIHRRSSRPDAIPLLLTHGWPGSIVEFMRVIEPLAEPDRHGAPGAPAFHVVCPSLPGFGLSGRPTERGWNFERCAAAWTVLMQRLGYSGYIAQGGDLGALVSTLLGQHDPNCRAVHLNILMAPPVDDGPDAADAPVAYGVGGYNSPGHGSDEEADGRSELERKSIAAAEAYATTGTGYVAIQSTRPQTLAFGLTDSPIGQAAWILEKFWEWSDRDGLPGGSLPMDDLLDNVTLYWLTGTNSSAARMYLEILPITNFAPIPVPTGVSVFPNELLRATRRSADARYGNIVQWVEHEAGGHFAAMEQPDLLVADLRALAELLDQGVG